MEANGTTMKQHLFYIALVMTLGSLLLVCSCANRGSGPQGGPKDETPPKMQKSTPPDGTVNFHGNKLEIVFDEIVVVNNAYENVVISPPQTKAPIVKAIGKKVRVELPDTLCPNTTYTIDFGDAIKDNNEGNALASFSTSFATGAVIDTLQIAGTVLDAATLNPVPKIVVGIHADTTDTAFRTRIFNRITKTDANGSFCLRNIKAGTYRLYALGDIGNNYRFDVPNEKIAFCDSLITPLAHTAIVRDTVWRDSISARNDGTADTLHVVDSVRMRVTTRYTPDSIILLAFTEDNRRQYLAKSERTQPYKFSLYFGTKSDTLPTITPLNFRMDSTVHLQTNEQHDTLHYWLTDSTVWQIDTLKMLVHYLKTDSTNQLAPQTDTLELHTRHSGNSINTLGNRKKGKRNNKGSKTEFIALTTNITNKYDFFKPIEIKFETPTQLVNSNSLHLELKQDSLWQPCTLRAKQTDDIGLCYELYAELKQGETYRLTVDSAAFHELYGKHSAKYSAQFEIKTDEAYAKLIFEIGNYHGGEIIEILDKNDAVLRTVPVTSTMVTIPYLNPGEYYARIFIDLNGNGRWDTGNYTEHKQAEPVFYYPYSIQLRAFWDKEEYWDYREIPLLEQKPKALKKTDDKK